MDELDNQIVTVPEIFAVPVAVKPGLVRIDVNAVNLPEDFFGAAFHLEINGSEWHLLEYKKGPAFGKNDPVILVKEKQTDGHSIVTGLSLTRDSIFRTDDGTMISFFISTPGQFSVSGKFDRMNMVAFDGNARRDVKADWCGFELQTESARIKEVMTNKTGLKADLLSPEQATSASLDGPVRIFKSVDSETIHVYEIMFWALVVLLSLALLFLMIKGKAAVRRAGKGQ